MNAQIYTTNTCPFCVEAKRLLVESNIEYEEYLIASRTDPVRDELATKMQPFMQDGQKLTVPQIWIDEQYIGGYDRLCEWVKT